MKKLFTFLLIIILSANLMAQGTLMLVGGGTERSGNDAWNYNPYTKAVKLATNSRVAIVAWGAEPDSWLRDYFTGTCNAAAAKHFDFSTIDAADYSTMYDSLMTYDMFFFKGGDQHDYYSNFKNTDIAQAITDKYTEGGVISGTSAGMAILSSVLFTASNGTVYPDEALNNPTNQYMNLANDFTDLMPDYLFDTHFAERGRFPRLVGMLTNWFKTRNGARITGLGVDDLTALIIRNDSVYGYGTGAGNFYNVADAQFDTTQSMTVVQNIKVSQLLNNCTYDITNDNFGGFSQQSTPELEGEGGNYTILLCGNSQGSYDRDMMETLVNETGNANDSVLIISGSNSTNASTLKSEIENYTSATVQIFEAISANGSNQNFSSSISSTGKFVFVDNTYSTFMDFIQNTDNGQQLYEKIHMHHSITAFIGDNSRFAGKTVVNEYLTSGASYYAELTFDPGLALLKTSVVMPKTFDNADIYENTSTAVPYAMLTDELTFGIWLNSKNYAMYHVQNDSTWLKAYGDSPVMVIKNNGTACDFSVTPNMGDNDARMIAGFEEMTLSVFNAGQPYLMGTELGLGLNPAQNEIRGMIYPNPASNTLNCTYPEVVSLKIVNTSGQIIKRLYGQKRYKIDVAGFTPGLYFFTSSATNGTTTTHKIAVK